jgi:hypothetical protein
MISRKYEATNLYVWGYDKNNKITNILQIPMDFTDVSDEWAAWSTGPLHTNDYNPPSESAKPAEKETLELIKNNNPTNDIGSDFFNFEYVANHYDKIKRLEVKKNTSNWEWVDFEYEKKNGSYITKGGTIISSTEFNPILNWADIPKGLNVLELKAIDGDDKESNILKWEFWNGTQLKLKHTVKYNSSLCYMIVNQSFKIK